MYRNKASQRPGVPPVASHQTAHAVSSLRPPRRSALAAVTLCVAVTAAGGGGASAQAATPKNSPTKVDLVLSMQNANVKQQDPATYEIVQAFMKKYRNVDVTIQGQVVATHEQDMEIAAQTHTLPDIFWVYNSLAQPMAKQGDLLNLAPVLDSLHITSAFPSNMLSGYREGNIQYGLPYQSLVTGFYYNKAILKKYNLTLPSTFAQLVSVVKVLHAHGVATIEQGANQSSYSIWAFLTMLDRFGYQSMYKNILVGKGSYDNPHFLALYSDIQTLAKDGAFNSDMTTETYVQAAQSFISGKAAMFDSGVWQASQIQASSIGNAVGFWPGPTFPNGVGDQHVLMNAPSAPLVVSAADKKDPARYNAVKEFIGFYYGAAGQQILVDNLQTPVTKYKPTGPAVKKPVFAAVINEIRTPGWTSPQAQPDLVVSSNTANAMYNSIYGVMEGVYSPKQALQSVQQTITK